MNLATDALLALAIGLSAVAGGNGVSAQAPAVAPVVKTAPAAVAVTPGAIAKIAALVPPADAARTKSVGKGSVQIGTVNDPSDDDSYWIQEIDMDGDGDVEATSFVWDDEDKILFAYSDGAFTCRNGAKGTGGLIIGINAGGNPRNRPAGSGFWAAEIDKSECSAQTAGIVGCRFDASGTPTACGLVVIDAKNDDIVSVTAQN